MPPTPSERAAHITDAIADVRRLRASASDEQIKRDRLLKAALERLFEIISEASRHIPDDHRAAYPQIPWKRIAGIGNVLRHAYEGIDIDLLLNTAGTELDALEHAVSALLNNRPE